MSTDQTTPLPDEQLNQIEARAVAATDGPWGVYGFGGDTLIEIAADLEETGHGYRARRVICRLEDEPMDNDPTHREWTAEEDWAQVQADAAFIAHAREDVDALVDEIRRIQRQRRFLIDQLAKKGAASGETERRLREFLSGEEQPASREDLAGPDAEETDTLPAWLYQRFAVIHGAPAWDRLADRDRAYWEHHAHAVRRAVERGAVEAADEDAAPVV